MEPEITIAHRLRIAREFAGLEQQELADALDVARGTVSNAELGKRTPRRIMIKAWALRCGVSLDWIENGPKAAQEQGAKSTFV